MGTKGTASFMLNRGLFHHNITAIATGKLAVMVLLSRAQTNKKNERM
jgi:hypothetical protein